MLNNIVKTLIAWGPIAVFFIAILDSIGVPLVGGVDALIILTAVKTPQLAYLAAALAVAGSLAGNLFLFRAAWYGSTKFTGEPVPGGRREKFRLWFYRYGLLTVFIPAVTPFVPLPLKVFVISAGAIRTPWRRFLVVVLVARVFRYFGEAYLGIRLGHDATGFLRDNVWNIVGIFLALALVLVALIKWNDRRRVEA
uniref:Membrane protein n=1 Tax=Solibacter usitatus (strain Ellin6076) TaxID=234267 RepID=Q01T56_SOLUE